ncbi:restriction endonuclease subunit S [Streptococcus macedonicus]|uniref:restriction endonuclease subunit S n=1 Tax=Streptococcus macedonicus TaxID=59310 RepID=UPI0022E71865|nr:restriction endonuclease subunit S [Streptococcus macedonicus]
MSEKATKTPQIRFDGYTDAWEERKLGDIAPLRGGFAFKSSKFRNTGVPIVRISNILSSGEVGGDFVYYDEQDKDDKYILPDKSAILAMSGATTGKVSILSLTDYDKVYQNQRVGYFQSVDDIDYGFISTIVRSELFMTQLESVLVSGAQPNVSSKEIDSFNFMIPILVQEQQKIGVFFKKLDEIIALHQRKCDLLAKMKKSYLQKMFPKNGEDKPEIRFDGYTDAWEQRKASELFKSISDKKHPNLPVLSASQEKGMILRDDIGIDIKYDHKSLSNYKRVTPGQFVIHLRSFQGGFAVSQMEGITSPAYTIIDFKEKDQNHSLFWKEILTSQSFIKRLETVTYGIRDGRSISFSDFSTLKFLVPKLDEQEKIAVLFKTLDQTITLHQRELDSLKKMKKSLLQMMFV